MRYKLKTNCRNTPQIAKATASVTGFGNAPDIWRDTLGLSVEREHCKEPEDVSRVLPETVRGLVKDEIPVADIVILMPGSRKKPVWPM